MTFTPIAKNFMLYCRLIYMLSILCVRLTIKVKVGIPESFKVGWCSPQKTGSSHLNMMVRKCKWRNSDLNARGFSTITLKRSPPAQRLKMQNTLILLQSLHSSKHYFLLNALSKCYLKLTTQLYHSTHYTTQTSLLRYIIGNTKH